MKDEPTDRDSRASDELRFTHGLWDLSLDLLTQLLAARAGANEARDRLKQVFLQSADPLGLWRGYVFPGIDPTEIRNLVFDLARLHVQSLGDLTRISARYTDSLAGRLRERPSARAASSPARQYLVRLQRSGNAFEGEFEVENGTTGEDAIALPQVVSFHRADSNERFAVEARFTPGRLVLSAGQRERVRVTVHRHDWIETGRHYEATLTLSMSRGSSLELTLQLTG